MSVSAASIPAIALPLITTSSCLRLLSHPEFKAAYIPEVLVTMRVGGASNRSLRNVIRKSREDYQALRASEVGGLGTLAWKNVSKVGQFLGRR